MSKRTAKHLFAYAASNSLIVTACRRVFYDHESECFTSDPDLVSCGNCERRPMFRMIARDRETDIRRVMETAEPRPAPWSWYIKGAKLIAMGVGLGKTSFKASTHY